MRAVVIVEVDNLEEDASPTDVAANVKALLEEHYPYHDYTVSVEED